MSSQLISVIANLALTLSVIVALVFGVAQIKVAARDRRERLTMETLRTFQTREFAEMALYITSNELPLDRDGMAKLPANEQAILFQFAQQMESLGLLVAEKLVNIDLVDKTLGSFVASSWEKYKKLFYDIRVNQPDPFLGEYFQWLAEQINERMAVCPRKPFHEINTRMRR